MKKHEVGFCYHVITGSEVLRVAASWKSARKKCQFQHVINKGFKRFLVYKQGCFVVSVLMRIKPEL